MITIRMRNVHARVLKDVDLTVTAGELFALIGPSGAGKSTLLQALAGLLAYQGKIFFGDRCIDRLPPHRRKVGYLFQDLLLFPHLTVQKNIILAMVHLKKNRARMRQKARNILTRFGIAHLANRFPGEMSGGEKQRAALARAIATEPKILLLDEPFSSLDETTAQHLRGELKQHQRHFNITTIFVTHNLNEARELGDRSGMIQNGRLTCDPDTSDHSSAQINRLADAVEEAAIMGR